MRAMVTFWSLQSMTLQHSGTAPLLWCVWYSQAHSQQVNQPSDNTKLENGCLEEEDRSPVYQPDLSPNLQHRGRLGLR